MKVCLICPSCGGQCDRLFAFAYCPSCWYTVCGGDLADYDLAVAPAVLIVGGVLP